MRKINNQPRLDRLISMAIDAMNLDLSSITVLTEAASGPYALTPIIAAVAGASHVIAVTGSSEYGAAEDIQRYTEELAGAFGVRNRIDIVMDSSRSYASQAHLVTNLGFVRPIDHDFVSRMPDDGAVALMCEPWEVRSRDIDIAACRDRGVPALGTDENDSRLDIFRYVGMTALKLLMELGVELFDSSVVVVGSGRFGDETQKALESVGAKTLRLDPSLAWGEFDDVLHFLSTADAVALCEHQVDTVLLGGSGAPLKPFIESGAVIAHICGRVDENEVNGSGLRKAPAVCRPFGYMNVATDYVGPKPVINLHTAGLKVGAELVIGMRRRGNPEKAMEHAMRHSPAKDFGPVAEREADR